MILWIIFTTFANKRINPNIALLFSALLQYLLKGTCLYTMRAESPSLTALLVLPDCNSFWNKKLVVNEIMSRFAKTSVN